MATDLPGRGSKLQIKNSTFQDVSQCSEISWDGYSVALRNPTHLGSTSVRKKAGLPNYGQIKAKVLFDPNDTVHKLLRDRVKTPAAANDEFKMIYADGFVVPANADFFGFVSEFTQSGFEPETGTLTFDLTIEVDSISAFTDGAAS